MTHVDIQCSIIFFFRNFYIDMIELLPMMNLIAYKTKAKGLLSS